MKRFLCFLTYWMGLSLLPLVASSSDVASVWNDAIPYENSDTSSIESFTIHYRRDHTDIDTLYLDNAAQIAYIRHCLRNSPKIDSISIHAWASPEGTYRHNTWLSRKRAETARDFILAQVADSSRLSASQICVNPSAENWPGLIKVVEEGYDRHDREKLLEILRDPSIGDETRKWRLKQLDNGYTWTYLTRKYMPHLRSATWICVWMKAEMPSLDRLASIEAQSIDVPSETELDVPSVSKFKGKIRRQKDEIFYLRTNLLAPLSNVGAEVCLNDNWSLGADYYFPWVPRNPNNVNCFQLLGWSLEGRYWFGKYRTWMDRLEGHSVGVNVAGGYYDFEKDYAGNQGEFAEIGFDYLYSLPVCKDRLHIEFSIGLGYIYSHMKPYDVFEDGGKAYKTDYTKNFHWVGPTKATVSLVVPIKFARRAGK